jgi:uncharacterized protein (DUF1697 family)
MAETTSSDRFSAFLRGINVGVAKRVSMADLKALVERTGAGEVRTLQAAGNVVFSAPGSCEEVRERLEQALHADFGEKVTVAVLSAEQLTLVLAENPYAEREGALKQAFVGFFGDSPSGRAAVEGLAEREWDDEELSIGERAVFMWCPHGTTSSKLQPAVGRALGKNVTVRGWGTVMRTAELLGVVRG